jgi:superfamily II DNA helicase RecQ
MARKVQRVRYTLNAKGIRSLSQDEIAAILRGADELILRGGRNLLSKILKGSREKKVLELGLDKSVVYGFYKDLTLEEISARIDWVIKEGYLCLEYEYRLPLLAYTGKGWEIEKDTYSSELLREFDKMLEDGSRLFNVRYLKDKNRELIWMLLDKIEASGDRKDVPILESWEKTDYRKVGKRIRQVIQILNQGQYTSAQAPE